MRAALYARRSSSDRDERQVQSIEDQVRIMTERAGQEGLLIAEEITESKSAKEPYQRPKFDCMLTLLDKGQVDSILCWHLNRLFRNSVDMSAIQWRLQRGIIKKIITPERTYLPEDNVLLFYVEAGVSNQTVLDLSKAVKRGMNSKVLKGWFPHRVPAGYLNNKWMEKGEKTISPDPERFLLIREAWRLMLSGNYTVPEIHHRLNHIWHYRSRQTKLSGGAPVGRSTLYSIFTNIFYAGYFRHDGRLYQGAHEPMVTLQEFQKVQELLGREQAYAEQPPATQEGSVPIDNALSSRRQPQKYEFSYTGLMRCTRCGHLITAQRVTKPSGKHYSYYFCQNTTGGCRKIAVREDRLEEQLDQLLQEMILVPELVEWGRAEIEAWRQEEQGTQQAVAEKGQETLRQTERQLENLLTLKIKDLISDDEYITRRTKLHNEMILLQAQAQEHEQASNLYFEAIENALDFSANAREWLVSGDVKVKRALARALVSNFAFEEGKVLLEPHPLLLALCAEARNIEPQLAPIKPLKNRSANQESEALQAVRSAWSGTLNRIRLLALNNSLSFPKIQAIMGGQSGVPDE